jgi:hypothetical protein
MFVDAFYFPGHALPLGPALSGVTVKIADFRRLLFPLWRHPGWVGLARNAAGPELLSRQIVLGRPLFFADFRGHDLPSRAEHAHEKATGRGLLGSAAQDRPARPRLRRAGDIELLHAALGGERVKS